MTQIIFTEITGTEMTDDEYVKTAEYAVVSCINGQRTQAKKILKRYPDQVQDFINMCREQPGCLDYLDILVK